MRYFTPTFFEKIWLQSCYFGFFLNSRIKLNIIKFWFRKQKQKNSLNILIKLICIVTQYCDIY